MVAVAYSGIFRMIVLSGTKMFMCIVYTESAKGNPCNGWGPRSPPMTPSGLKFPKYLWGRGKSPGSWRSSVSDAPGNLFKGMLFSYFVEYFTLCSYRKKLLYLCYILQSLNENLHQQLAKE